MLWPVIWVFFPIRATLLVFTGRSLCSFAFAIVSVEDIAIAAGGDAFLLLLADALAAIFDPLHLWACAGIVIGIACSLSTTCAVFAVESLCWLAVLGIGPHTGCGEVVVGGACACGIIGDSRGCAHRKGIHLLRSAMFLWALAIFPAWHFTRAWRLALAGLPVEFVVVGARHFGRVV